jgi:hypothetical protein
VEKFATANGSGFFKVRECNLALSNGGIIYVREVEMMGREAQVWLDIAVRLDEMTVFRKRSS